jgi:hypothetical protein
MDFKSEMNLRFLRVIAIVALLLGLGDAARLLGVTSGETSPLELLGPTGFVYLAVFCLARLFSAVGLWLGASWGAVLLVGATVIEIVLFLAGNQAVNIDFIGFGVRLLIIVAIGILFMLSLRLRRAHD